jgi:hypothetical protein
MTAAIAPPADRPLTNTRPGSMAWRICMAFTIWRIESASPPPLRASCG